MAQFGAVEEAGQLFAALGQFRDFMLAEDLDSRQHVPGREVRFLEAVLQYRWSTPYGAEFRKDFRKRIRENQP